MKKIIFLVLFILTLTLFLKADIYIKREYKFVIKPQDKKHIDEHETSFVVEIWIGDNYYSLIDDGSPMIVDLDKKRIYYLDHHSKTYFERIYDTEKFEKELTEEKIQELKNEVTEYISKIEVQPIKEKKKIGAWLCTGYRIKHKKSKDKEITTEVWATKDVPFDWELLDQINERLYSEKIIQLKEYLYEGKRVPEIEGFIIEVTSTKKMREETRVNFIRVLEISENPPPEWIYTFPKNYKKRMDIE